MIYISYLGGGGRGRGDGDLRLPSLPKEARVTFVVLFLLVLSLFMCVDGCGNRDARRRYFSRHECATFLALFLVFLHERL